MYIVIGFKLKCFEEIKNIKIFFFWYEYVLFFLFMKSIKDSCNNEIV